MVTPNIKRWLSCELEDMNSTKIGCLSLWKLPYFLKLLLPLRAHLQVRMFSALSRCHIACSSWDLVLCTMPAICGCKAVFLSGTWHAPLDAEGLPAVGRTFFMDLAAFTRVFAHFVRSSCCACSSCYNNDYLFIITLANMGSDAVSCTKCFLNVVVRTFLFRLFLQSAAAPVPSLLSVRLPWLHH